MTIEEVKKSPKDVDWTEHVLEQLTDDEKFNGNPTVDGLRRLVEIFLGPIVRSESDVIQSPTIENNHRATVMHMVTIIPRHGHELSFGGVADVCGANTDPVYAKFPTSMAETRAEGRALRRALKLRKVVSAEELTTVGGTPESAEVEYITKGQISILDTLCCKGRGCDINVVKLLNSDGVEYKNLSRVPKSVAAKFVQDLSSYQQDVNSIPSVLKGYDPDWRKE
jgi:hypothetical protein